MNWLRIISNLCAQFKQLSVKLAVSRQEHADRISELESTIKTIKTETEVLRRQCKIGRLMQARTVDPAGEAVQRWLSHTVKLPQYWALLLENGFDDLDCFTDVTGDILEAIGISKLGHRHKLLRYAGRLDSSSHGSSLSGQRQSVRQSDCISHIWSDDSVQYSVF